MSNELVAALVGAVTGGIIALFGGIAQVFIQGWISDRGRITYELAVPEISFTLRRGPFLGEGGLIVSGTREKVRAYYLSLSPAERQNPDTWSQFSVSVSFTVNFLNRKGANAALLEYSVQFLKGNQTLITRLPSSTVASPIVGEQSLREGQAVSLAADSVTAISMRVSFGSVRAGKTMKEVEEVLMEADSVQFTARLSTGQDIKAEVLRLSQDAKRIEKGDAV